jgi:uncharacterized integral membrane protein
MRARLGRIIYRGGVIGAALTVAFVIAGALLNIGHENWHAIVRALIVAAIAWGIGRVALYALAAR